ncbi:MAG: GGDEF domain-containing protein [Thermodesulfobacteriota bacterium]
MEFSAKKILVPVAMCGVCLLIAGLFAAGWQEITSRFSGQPQARAFLQVLPAIPYAVLFVGFAMGWRYGNSGMMLSCLAFFAAYACTGAGGGPTGVPGGEGPELSRVAAFLLPFNIVAGSLLIRRRPFTPLGVSAFSLFFIQCLLAFSLSQPKLASLAAQVSSFSPSAGRGMLTLGRTLSSFIGTHPVSFCAGMTAPALAAFAWTLPFLLLRYVLYGMVLQSGMFTATAAALLAFCSGKPETATLFFLASGIVIVVTSVEASFSMAYLDELTGLPGRRSLNEALLNLPRSYAVAMIDIDHFKKFNDRYGHKVGDQVLRMVGSRLRQMPGNAQVFRYGGEEFTALFPGKIPAEALPFLEKYRADVADAPFTIRSQKREGRSAADRGKKTQSMRKRVKITVSIGISGPDKGRVHPEMALKAADKLLYEAKKAGRNCVKI